jgi:hypothetical protein
VASIFAARGWTILWAVFSAAALIICLSFSIPFIMIDDCFAEETGEDVVQIVKLKE